MITDQRRAMRYDAPITTRPTLQRLDNAVTAHTADFATTSATQTRPMALCPDLNWDELGRAASPGLYAHADPAAHVDWAAGMGANVLQTFAVSFNGYAWFPSSSVAPVTPGMRHDLLGESVRLGHKRGLRVFGYFCLSSNPWYECEHPDEVHPLDPAAPFQRLCYTQRYVDHLAQSVRDAVDHCAMDGFLLDWVRPTLRRQWLDCEKQMFQELLGEAFPTHSEPDQATTLAFDRAAVERAWAGVQAALDDTRQVEVWTNHPLHQADDPFFTGLGVLREADGVMNEGPYPELMEWLKQQLGPQGRIVQCLAGWADHDTTQLLDTLDDRTALYAFAAIHPTTALPYTDKAAHLPATRHFRDLALANTQNLGTIRRLFHDQ